MKAEWDNGKVLVELETKRVTQVEFSTSDIEELVATVADPVTQLRIVKQILERVGADKVQQVADFITDKAKDHPFCVWLKDTIQNPPWKKQPPVKPMD